MLRVLPLRLLLSLMTFCFVSPETKRVYFDFSVNYLHSEVEWPIKTIIMLTNTKAKGMGHKYGVLTI